MNENPGYNQQIVQVNVNNNQQLANIQNLPHQSNRLVILDQAQNINANVGVYNQQGQLQGQMQISYEKSELVAFFAGGKSLAKMNVEKAKPNQYNSVNVDSPELFDGKIKCVRLKCVVYGIITALLNTLRLGYLLFLHLGYPIIVWLIRFLCAIILFIVTFCKDDPETILIEPESGLERIDYERGKFAAACALCGNCAKAFVRFFLNLFKCPCWFYPLVMDCFYDIKNRALDNARTGCYKFIHYDFGIYEKVIENPFNNYMKKRHIILTTNPDDPTVIYGDACKDNTVI